MELIYVLIELRAVVLRKLLDPFLLQINFVTLPSFEIHCDDICCSHLKADYHSWVIEKCTSKGPGRFGKILQG